MRFCMDKMKSLPVQAWNALGPGRISKHSLSHTQMHKFLTQTITAGMPRHWRRNAKTTLYSRNRTAGAPAEGEPGHLHFPYEDAEDHGLVIQAQHLREPAVQLVVCLGKRKQPENTDKKNHIPVLILSS